MGPHQGQAQLMDFLEELFDTFVFGDPCLYLGQQVLRNVGRTSLVPRAFAGDVLAGMQRTAMMATAFGAAAAMGVGIEAGGQDGRARGQFLEPTIEHAADLRRVVRDAHG